MLGNCIGSGYRPIQCLILLIIAILLSYMVLRVFLNCGFFSRKLGCGFPSTGNGMRFFKNRKTLFLLAINLVSRYSKNGIGSVVFTWVYFPICITHILLLMSGNVHPNPGPTINREKNTKKLHFGIWNADSIVARNFAKIPLLEALQEVENFDIFGICESMLSDSYSTNLLQLWASRRRLLDPTAKQPTFMPMVGFAYTLNHMFQLLSVRT